MWWDEIVFYELYVPSFCDSTGDGIGDFKGIIKKLDYLKELGIGGIWLTPFYKSPQVDNGYDISDYLEINPTYGTMKDFEEFLAEAKKREIRVIIDMVLNHVSDQHKWFIEAKKSKTSPYRDYFLWSDEVPNNWESFFSGTAWEYDCEAGQYYYHKFAKQQVDLNWRNPKVKEEIFDILKFWLKKGIDGFRLDVINFLSCEGICNIENPKDSLGNQIHKYDINQEGIRETIGEITKFVKNYGDKFLVGEIGSNDIEVLKQYGKENILDVVFNFNFGSKEKFNIKEIYEEIKSMEKNQESKPTLFFGSHDMARIMSRFNNEEKNLEKIKCITLLYLTAYGIPFIYYGDEIGMTNLLSNSINDINDIQGRQNYHVALSCGKTEEEALKIANEKTRDKSRSPMQWSNEKNSGFSNVEPWLRVNDNYKEINVEQELRDNKSLLNFYKRVLSFRNNSKVLQYGEYEELTLDEEMIIFIKKYHDEKIRVIINFGERKKMDLLCKKEKIIFGEYSEYLEKNKFIIENLN